MSDRFVGPIVRDTTVKFRDPRLNRSRQIPPEAVRDGIFEHLKKFRNLPTGSNQWRHIRCG